MSYPEEVPENIEFVWQSRSMHVMESWKSAFIFYTIHYLSSTVFFVRRLVFVFEIIGE